MDDDDLECYLADIEDVVNGRTASMEHAQVMNNIVDNAQKFEQYAKSNG